MVCDVLSTGSSAILLWEESTYTRLENRSQSIKSTRNLQYVSCAIYLRIMEKEGRKSL